MGPRVSSEKATLGQPRAGGFTRASRKSSFRPWHRNMFTLLRSCFQTGRRECYEKTGSSYRTFIHTAVKEVCEAPVRCAFMWGFICLIWVMSAYGWGGDEEPGLAAVKLWKWSSSETVLAEVVVMVVDVEVTGENGGGGGGHSLRGHGQRCHAVCGGGGSGVRRVLYVPSPRVSVMGSLSPAALRRSVGGQGGKAKGECVKARSQRSPTEGGCHFPHTPHRPPPLFAILLLGDLWPRVLSFCTPFKRGRGAAIHHSEEMAFQWGWSSRPSRSWRLAVQFGAQLASWSGL